MTTKTKTPSKTTLLKKVDNYAVLEIGYNKIVLPFTDAITVMSAMTNAESIEGYGDQLKIMPLDKDGVTMKAMSEGRYLAAKMTHLLKCPISPDTFEPIPQEDAA